MLPAFEGSMYQDGNGLGEVLGSVFRTIFTIITSGATTFLRGAAEGWSQGKCLSEAANGAIGPAAQDFFVQTYLVLCKVEVGNAETQTQEGWCSI